MISEPKMSIDFEFPFNYSINERALKFLTKAPSSQCYFLIAFNKTKSEASHFVPLLKKSVSLTFMIGRKLSRWPLEKDLAEPRFWGHVLIDDLRCHAFLTKAFLRSKLLQSNAEFCPQVQLF